MNDPPQTGTAGAEISERVHRDGPLGIRRIGAARGAADALTSKCTEATSSRSNYWGRRAGELSLDRAGILRPRTLRRASESSGATTSAGFIACGPRPAPVMATDYPTAISTASCRAASRGARIRPALNLRRRLRSGSRAASYRPHGRHHPVNLGVTTICTGGLTLTSRAPMSQPGPCGRGVPI